MLRINFNVINFDYENIADRFLPILLKEKTANHKLSNIIANMLLVKDGSASNFTKGIIKVIPKRAKNNLVYDFITNNKEKIIESVNRNLEDYQIGICLSDMRIKIPDKVEYDMLKFEISLNEIDYNSVIENALPNLFVTMAEKSDKHGELAKVLLNMKDTPIKMIIAALDIMPQQERNDLIVNLMTIYNDDIIKSINSIVSDQRITAEIASIKVENQSDNN